MSIRTKILALIGATLVALVLLLSISSYCILQRSFSEQEEQRARADVLRVRNAVDDELAWLHRTAEDWSAWDDTYHYVQHSDPAYLVKDLNAPSLLNLKINLIVLFNNAGEILIARDVDQEHKTVREITGEMRERLRAYRAALRPTPAKQVDGILLLPHAPILVSASPVRKSDFTGPFNGTLLMGRYLDSSELAHLSTVTDLTVTLSPAPAPSASGSPTPQRPIAISRASAQTLRGDSLITDLNQQPAGVFSVALSRALYQQGVHSLHWHILIICLIGGVFGVVMLWLVETLVLRRLLGLAQHVREIGVDGDLHQRLPMPDQHDEFYALAGSINLMLSGLDAGQQAVEIALRELNEALEQQVNERTAALRESEERFRTLFENNHAVMLLVDPHTGAVINANPAACKFYGYAHDVLLSKRLADLNTLPPKEIMKLMARAAAGKCRYFSFRHRLANGDVRDVDVYSGPISHGGRVLLHSIVHDVTERRGIEQALERERAYLSAALDTLTMPLVILSRTGETIMSNRADAELLARLGISDIKETCLLDPHTRAIIPHAQLPLVRALRGETITSQAYILLAPDGTQQDILVHASPIRLHEEIVAAVRAIEDITPLKDADRAKDEFLAVLSHELQTPLTSMLGWSDLALAQGQPELMRQAMDVVHRNARRQQLLIADMLDVSRLLHRKLQLQCKPLDLGEQAQHTVESMLPEAGKWGGRLIWEPISSPLPVLADAGRMQQCIGNLLQNSMKYTPADGTITVRCYRDGDSAVVEVSDTGRGIAPDAITSIFTSFHQVNRDERVGGLGLGLAIVNGIVALHDGRVTAESPGPQRGSTFRIFLPLLTT